MCGIAGALYFRPVTSLDIEQVGAMGRLIAYRGPDEQVVVQAGPCVLTSVRLSIVDVASGQQPYSSKSGRVHAVFNGEIYNHKTLRTILSARGCKFSSNSDGEVIAHLYEEYGLSCFKMLEGQFAIAIADVSNGSVILARDRMGICPLHWVKNQEGVYFCSEIKGLLEIGAALPRVNDISLLQMAYFGTVCAPLTAFKNVHALQPAHYLSICADGVSTHQRYWALDFPRIAEQAEVKKTIAIEELNARLEAAVESHTQGEFPATCFLSGGVDSAIIGGILSRQCRGRQQLHAFCATSEHEKINEEEAALKTAQVLGLNFNPVQVGEADISKVFGKLIWHAEVPTISTEAAALYLLSEKLREHSKIVLTGEGADEAFGGYLAFRQSKLLGPLTSPGLSMLRSAVRPLLEHHYGSDCLLPSDVRIDSVRSHIGCFPAQAYEWEFYRAAIMPVLAPKYREMLLEDRQWEGFIFDREAVRDRHWLNRSLYVGYQVMLPNYLLGPHGDRLFAANSIEGRYPFLDRSVVEYSASLPPSLKIHGMRDKYVLRCAAQHWLPREIAMRPKKRFVMPFGTPFTGPRAPAIYRYLLGSDMLRDYGYFEPQAVQKVVSALSRVPVGRQNARTYLECLGLGISLTLVVSMQLWNYLFISNRWGHSSAKCRSMMVSG